MRSGPLIPLNILRVSDSLYSLKPERLLEICRWLWRTCSTEERRLRALSWPPHPTTVHGALSRGQPYSTGKEHSPSWPTRSQSPNGLPGGRGWWRESSAAGKRMPGFCGWDVPPPWPWCPQGCLRPSGFRCAWPLMSRSTLSWLGLCFEQRDSNLLPNSEYPKVTLIL